MEFGTNDPPLEFFDDVSSQAGIEIETSEPTDGEQNDAVADTNSPNAVNSPNQRRRVVTKRKITAAAKDKNLVPSGKRRKSNKTKKKKVLQPLSVILRRKKSCMFPNGLLMACYCLNQ